MARASPLAPRLVEEHDPAVQEELLHYVEQANPFTQQRLIERYSNTQQQQPITMELVGSRTFIRQLTPVLKGEDEKTKFEQARVVQIPSSWRPHVIRANQFIASVYLPPWPSRTRCHECDAFGSTDSCQVAACKQVCAACAACAAASHVAITACPTRTVSNAASTS